MPVAEHEVHERTKIGSDFKYECNNRPAFKKFYYAPERRYLADGRFVVRLTKVAHVLSRDCQQIELWASDPGCRGCKRGKK